MLYLSMLCLSMLCLKAIDESWSMTTLLLSILLSLLSSLIFKSELTEDLFCWIFLFMLTLPLEALAGLGPVDRRSAELLIMLVVLFSSNDCLMDTALETALRKDSHYWLIYSAERYRFYMLVFSSCLSSSFWLVFQKFLAGSFMGDSSGITLTWLSSQKSPPPSLF